MTFRSWTTPGITLNGVAGGFPKISTLPGGSGQIVSINHDLRLLGKADCGGPFFLDKTDREYSPTRGITLGGYTGDVISWQPSNMPSNLMPGDVSLTIEGTTAIARTTPTNPVFDGATFLGESLSDGAPGIIGSQVTRAKVLRAKQAGSEYLNYEFGWLPLVSDLRNFAYAVKNSSELVEKFCADANHLIHRRYSFPDATASTVTNNSSFIRAAAGVNVGSTPTGYWTSNFSETRFSGAYKYYVPVGNDARSRFRRYKSLANKLFGARLTPETVWNVSPWSWAVDWQTDIGDVIHNQAALGHDGLVLLYGYITHEIRSQTGSGSRYGYHRETRHAIRRLPATPYGFGVDMGKLSNTQIAVLVALGMSHGR